MPHIGSYNPITSVYLKEQPRSLPLVETVVLSQMRGGYLLHERAEEGDIFGFQMIKQANAECLVKRIPNGSKTQPIQCSFGFSNSSINVFLFRVQDLLGIELHQLKPPSVTLHANPGMSNIGLLPVRVSRAEVIIPCTPALLGSSATVLAPHAWSCLQKSLLWKFCHEETSWT